MSKGVRMDFGIQLVQALAAGAVASFLFWLCWGWQGWLKWLAFALPFALGAYLVLFGLVRAG